MQKHFSAVMHDSVFHYSPYAYLINSLKIFYYYYYYYYLINIFTFDNGIPANMKAIPNVLMNIKIFFKYSTYDLILSL